MSRDRKPSAKSASTASAGVAANTPRHYWDQTASPRFALLFVGPILIAYELGAWWLRSQAGGSPQLVAQAWVADALAWFGPQGAWVPALILIATLLALIVLERGRHGGAAWMLPVMLLESVLLAAPLVLMNRLMLLAETTPDAWTPTGAAFLPPIGGAIYEEYFFRLLPIGVLAPFIAWAARLPSRPTQIVVLILAAAAFARAHAEPFGGEALDLGRFLLRALAGLYLGAVFLLRGFGVAVGVHAAHNAAIAALLVMH